jgi:hypothetical protein
MDNLKNLKRIQRLASPLKTRRLFAAEQARMRELTECYKGAGHQQKV